jgi:hypothetical protein
MGSRRAIRGEMATAVSCTGSNINVSNTSAATRHAERKNEYIPDSALPTKHRLRQKIYFIAPV